MAALPRNQAMAKPVSKRPNAGLFLKRRETQSIIFTRIPEQMSVIDDHGRRVIEPGEFEISIGGRQPMAGKVAFQTAKFSVIGKTDLLVESQRHT